LITIDHSWISLGPSRTYWVVAQKVLRKVSETGRFRVSGGEPQASIQLHVLDSGTYSGLRFTCNSQDPVAIHEQTRQLDASRVHAVPDSDGTLDEYGG